MLDYALTAQRLAKDRKRADLDADEVLHLALTRAVEVVGEAARRVSKEKRKELSGIPWSQIMGARNRLIHGDDYVDLDVLWDIITFDLQPLIEQLRKAIAHLSGSR